MCISFVSLACYSIDIKKHNIIIAFGGLTMDKNLKTTNIIRFVLIILAVAAIPFNTKLLFSPEVVAPAKAAACINIIALVFLGIYLGYGFKKEANYSFKAFMLCYCLISLICCLTAGSVGNDKLRLFSIGIVALSFAVVFMLTFSVNLGFKKSMILCCIDILARFAMLLFAIFTSQQMAALFTRSITLFITSLMMTVMTYAKYQNKLSRGKTV